MNFAPFVYSLTLLLAPAPADDALVPSVAPAESSAVMRNGTESERTARLTANHSGIHRTAPRLHTPRRSSRRGLSPLALGASFSGVRTWLVPHRAEATAALRPVYHGSSLYLFMALLR